MLLGAVIVLCFSSVDVLQANSEEKAVLPAVGLSPVLPVVQLLSLACGCWFFFFTGWPNVAYPEHYPHAGCLRKTWAKKLSAYQHTCICQNLGSSVVPLVLPWLGQVRVPGMPHSGLCFHVLTGAPDCGWGGCGLYSCSAPHCFERWPLFWASTSCGICSLPGKKEVWKAVMIPLHSSAMSSSSCHHWLWLDIVISDVKGRLAGAQVVDTSKRSD